MAALVPQSLTTPGASGADQPQIYGLLAPLMASAAAVYSEMKLYEEMEPIYAAVGDDVHDFIQVSPPHCPPSMVAMSSRCARTDLGMSPPRSTLHQVVWRTCSTREDKHVNTNHLCFVLYSVCP